jgi:hypothetical protein
MGEEREDGRGRGSEKRIWKERRGRVKRKEKEEK